MTPGTRYPGPIPSNLDPEQTFAGFANPAPWMRDAACNGLGDVMYPEGQGGERVRAAQQAREICGTCTVSAECLRAAIERDERYGVWGGVNMEDPTERRIARKLKRHHDGKPCRNCGLLIAGDNAASNGKYTPRCRRCNNERMRAKSAGISAWAEIVGAE